MSLALGRRSVAAIVACLVVIDVSSRAHLHALPAPAAVGYGALCLALVLYAAVDRAEA